MSEIPHRRPYDVFLKASDKQGDSSNKSRKRLKLSPKELYENPETVLKSRNCLNFLYSRELGSYAGEQAKKEFYQIKASHKEKVLFSNLGIPSSYDSCEVNFINGDDESLFGVWCVRTGKEKTYYNGEICYKMNTKDVVPDFEPCRETIDMSRCHTGLMNVFSYPNQFLPYIEISDFYFKVNKQFPPPWHCCCFIPGQSMFALGGDGYLMLIKFDGTIAARTNVPGKLCTLSFYEPLKNLVFGLDTGSLGILDHRGSPYCYAIKISDEAINDCVYLNENEVIATDVKGKLLKVDLRTRKPSATFFEHKHSVTKRPFSVANDMLCATGADNVVRIWPLSGGFPIYEQKPTSTHEARGWINSGGINTYLNYFERDTRTVFKI